jgi:pyrroline-5-carboxylate reductase
MINMIIGLIGCGNMGGALARGMVSGKLVLPENIYAHDTDEDKVARLVADVGCRRGELSQMVRGSDVLILAVKPADLAALAKEIAADIVGQTLLSVIAGARIKDITRVLGKESAVVRAMPNIAASVGRAVTCFTANDLVKKDARGACREILSGIGKVIEVEESSMDAVTAISGSGPAYFFYLAETMIASAREEGLSSELADTLVKETFRGASSVMSSSGFSPSELIKKVASRGGTTEAALSVFEEEAFAGTVARAIHKARKRAGELSEGR